MIQAGKKKEGAMNDKKKWLRAIMVIGSLLFLMIAGFTASTLPSLVSAAHAIASPSAAPGSFSALVKKASPSVVNINVEKVVEGREQAPMPFGPDDPFKDFFDRFFGTGCPRISNSGA
jgi:S1-C subfamily serine protease